jgi:hypothetical protein
MKKKADKPTRAHPANQMQVTLIYLDRKPSVETPSATAEPAKETIIEPREPLNDLQKRIEELIKGSDQTGDG